MKGIFRKPSCQHIIVATLRIDEFHGGQVVGQQLATVVGVHEMFREGLEGIGGKIGIVALTGTDKAAQQKVEFLLVDILLRACGDNAARAYIIEVVQPLCRVALKVVDIDVLEGVDRLSLQTYIIIIGGSDNGHLRFSITQTTQLTVAQLVALFVDTLQRLHRILTVFIKLPVHGTALAKTHLLDIAYKPFYLIISNFRDFAQPLLGLVILHLDDIGKGQVVESLCPSLVITVGQVISLFGIVFSGVNIPVVTGIRKIIQHVDGRSVRTRTG